MAVEDATWPSLSGKIVLEFEQLIRARTFVPALLKTTTQNRKAVAFDDPSVAPVAFVVIDSAAVCATRDVEPVAAVAFL
jgi:hypothetical protein